MDLLLKAVAIGILATLTMDVGALLGLRLGVAGREPQRRGPDLIGRWVGYMVRGRFRHSNILLTPPLPGEMALGVVIHYAIGIALALAYVALLGTMGMAPALLPALAYGVLTVAFPWFLMFPAIGAGWMGRAAPPGVHLTRASLYNHAVFGLGLAAGTMVFHSL